MKSEYEVSLERDLLGAKRFEAKYGKKAIRESLEESEELQQASIWMVGMGDKDEKIVEWTNELWAAQDFSLFDNIKEWTRNLLYCQNHQFVEWNNNRRRYMRTPTVKDRIRSINPVLPKVVNYRTNILTQNKPSVKVNAATMSPQDVEKAQYLSDLFNYHWLDKNIHKLIIEARLWAAKCGSGFIQTLWDENAGNKVPTTKYIPFEVPQPPIMVETPMGPIPQAQPPLQTYKEAYVIIGEDGQEIYSPVEEEVPDEQDPTKVTLKRMPIPDRCPLLPEGDVRLRVLGPYEVRFQYGRPLRDSWYYQVGRTLTGLEIVMEYPESEEVLKTCNDSLNSDSISDWRSLLSDVNYTPSYTGYSAASQRISDKKYFVLETWIFPKNELLRELWGDRGCKIITIGDKILSKEPLPQWALNDLNITQIIEIPEEGNGYGKSLCRDLVPIQDDINRMQTLMLEREFARSRPLLAALRGGGLEAAAVSGAPYNMITYKSVAHKPEILNFANSGSPGLDSFYATLSSNMYNLASMNEASQGRLPAAGIAAKAIYALQYADKESFAMTSNLQDESLRDLARSIAAICREEYTDLRKVRIVGDNGEYLLESEISPEHLDTNADYYIVPGSMLAINRESVKNELITAVQAGIPIPPDVQMRALDSGAPDAFRESYDPQVAHAKNVLHRIVRKGETGIQPEPWDNAQVHMHVLGTFLLDSQSLAIPERRQEVARLWQAYAMTLQPPPMAQPGDTPPDGGGTQEPSQGSGPELVESMAQNARPPEPPQAGAPLTF